MTLKPMKTLRSLAAMTALCGVSLAASPALGQQEPEPEPRFDPAPSDADTDTRENTLTPSEQADEDVDDDTVLADPSEVDDAEPDSLSNRASEEASEEATTDAEETPATTPTTTQASPPQSDLAASAVVAERELEQEKTFRPYMKLQSDFISFDNADYREFEPQDPVAFIDAFDADDRTTSGYTSLRGGFEYEPIEQVEVEISGGYKTLWGGDDLLFFDQAYVEYEAVDSDILELELKVGRQPFEVGGGARDFFFDDAIDAALVEADFNTAGEFTVFGDLYAAGARPEDISFSSGLGRSQDSSFRADGDNNVTRFGARYANTELVEGLDIRAFYFFADIGATDVVGTGSDRTFGQTFGVSADGDETWLAGTRVGYTLESGSFTLAFYGEFARSGGIDRKPTNLGLFDVGTEGNAFGGAVLPSYSFSENFGIRGLVQFYRADGAQYAADNGVLFNHGFVSMRGDQVGGIIANRISGWHPNAYIDASGVAQQMHSVERIAGTQMIHANLGFDIVRKLTVDFDLWTYQDTAESNFDTDRTIAASSELPFGYDEFDLRAQERAGTALGLEVNATIAYQPFEFLSFYVQGGLLTPGEFYEIEVDRRVGTGGESQRVAVGSDTPATAQAIMFGTVLELE